MNYYYLLGEDADNEVTVIAERSLRELIEEELCKEAEKGDFKNLRTFYLTNEGGHDDRGFLTRSEWLAIKPLSSLNTPLWE